MPKTYQQKNSTCQDRYVICASDELLLDPCTDDNLSSNEARILSVKAIGCPVKRACASIDRNGRSTYCAYLTTYPFLLSGDKEIGESLSCAKARKVLDARELKAENCPIKRTNCVFCEHLADIFLRAQRIDKSHSHIRCEKMR